MTNWWGEITEELQRKHPRLHELKTLEDIRNEKIDDEGLKYRKTYYFRGLSGFFLSLKFKN